MMRKLMMLIMTCALAGNAMAAEQTFTGSYAGLKTEVKAEGTKIASVNFAPRGQTTTVDTDDTEVTFTFTNDAQKDKVVIVKQGGKELKKVTVPVGKTVTEKFDGKQKANLVLSIEGGEVKKKK